MNWNKFISQFPRGGKIFLEYGKARMMDLVLKDGRLTLGYCTAGLQQLSESARKFFPILVENVANGFEMLVTSRVLADGPKVFSPGQIELELLEQMSLNIKMIDYVQPYESVIIELPDNYIKNKTVACPQAGQLMSGQLMPENHQPVLCIMHHRKDFNCVIVMLVFDSMQSIKVCMYPNDDEELDLYLSLMPTTSFYNFANCEQSTIEEMQVMEQVVRACMNYCLLLDEVGIRRAKNDNIGYHDRLQRYVKIAKKRGDAARLEKAEDELRMCPIRLELKQEVRLYKSVRTQEELPEATGRKNAPHYRRGHYRMQPFGPNRSERKRIRIPPVFVNKQFFLGDVSDTEVHYK